MELLHGETLATRLKAHGCLTWEQALVIGDDVLCGLIDAHEAGVIHRDLKPSNIFLCEPEPPGMTERAKILDFGACKLDVPDEERLTVTGESVGTVAYMAPEQIRGAAHVTARADLYAFATVMFEALSGKLPYEANSHMAMLACKLERPARPLSDVARVPVPVGLRPLLARLLANDAEARYATAGEVRDAWRALGPPVAAPRPADSALPAESPSPATETLVTTDIVARSSPRLSRLGRVVAALAAALSTVVAVFLVGTWVASRAPAEDLTSTTGPPASATLVDGPALPMWVPSLPALERGQGDARSLPGNDATAAPMPTAAPPPRPPTHPVSHGTTTKPHIVDRPRY